MLGDAGRPNNQVQGRPMGEQARGPILLVDDADMLRSLIAQGLRKRFPDIQVVEAQNVAEGFRRARQYRPQLAILDVSMPDGNGFDLSRRILKEFPETLVCICTLHDEPVFRDVAADSGATWFIAKQGDFWNDAECVVRSAFDGIGSGAQRCEGVSLQ